MKSYLKYPLIFLISFAAAGSLAYYAVTLFTQSAKTVVLPELRGKNIIYVLETLTRLGLNAKLFGTQFDDEIPKYSVISQDPEPGTTIKKGRDIIIYLSRGKKENIVPDLRQLELSQALITLEKHELKKGHISHTHSMTTASGRIIAQFPKPFATALKGSVCNLLVSSGPRVETYMMPDLTGLTIDLAAEMIQRRDLHLSRIVSGMETNKPMDTILGHTPGFGMPVRRDDKIILTVNTRQKNRTMNPERLDQVTLLRLPLDTGFLKSHVRIESDIYGTVFNLYDDFVAPGEEVMLLIPSGKKTTIDIYIDDELYHTTTLDPWHQASSLGDISWELLPLQFYPPTSQNLEMN